MQVLADLSLSYYNLIIWLAIFHLFVLHVFMHFPANSPPLWDDYTIVPLQIHSSRRRKHHGILWSSRRDWQSVVCEWRGPWDVDPRTRNGTWEDKRREKKAKLGQRTLLQETLTSKLPINHLGKVGWEPLAQHLALAEVPFPSTRSLDGQQSHKCWRMSVPIYFECVYACRGSVAVPDAL